MRKILYLFIFLQSIIANSQVTVQIFNVKVDNQPIGSNINLGSETSKYVTFQIKLEKPTNLTIGDSKLFVRSKANAWAEPITYIIPNIYESGFTDSNTFSYGFYFYSDDFDFTGGYLYATLVQNNSPGTAWSSNQVPVSKSPKYTITQDVTSISCGSTTPIKFTINSSASSSYSWSIGSGWNLTAGSINSNTVTLIPTSYPLTTIYVTPTFNGVVQQVRTFNVSLAAFNPLLQVVGSATGCSGTSSSYSILSSLPVTWSISNPNLATLNTTTGSTVSLTSIANGTVTLTATVSNACNQTKTFSKSILIGEPTLSDNHILGGNDNVSTNGYSVFTVAAATGATSYQWSVISVNANCAGPGGLTPPGVVYPTIVDNGYYSRKVNWGNCPGNYIVRCVATNSCAVKYYSDKQVNVFSSGSGGSNPCGRKMAVTPNPIKGDGTITVNIIQPPVDPPCDNTGLKTAQITIENIAVYDLKSNLVYSNKFKSNSITLNDLKLKKGLYIVQATTNDGTVISEKIVIE